MPTLERSKHWLAIQAADPTINRKTLWRVRTKDGELRPSGGTDWYIAQAIAEELREAGVECEVYDQGKPQHRRLVKGGNVESDEQHFWEL